MVYADGIEEFLKLRSIIMPTGYQECPYSFQRQLYDNIAKIFPFPFTPGVSYSDHGSRGGRTRKYTTASPSADDDKNGLIIYLHGGGFSMGGLHSHGDIAAEICAKTKQDVWLLEYPLAPENKYPAALDFCWQAFSKITKSSPSANIRLAADGSGSCIAVYLASKARQEHAKSVQKVALFCPILDFCRVAETTTDLPSVEEWGIQHLARCYTGDAVTTDHRDVSPLLHHDVFNDFPETLVISASEDNCRLDACILRDILESKGTRVDHMIAAGLGNDCMRAKMMSTTASQAFDRFWKFLE